MRLKIQIEVKLLSHCTKRQKKMKWIGGLRSGVIRESKQGRSLGIVMLAINILISGRRKLKRRR